MSSGLSRRNSNRVSNTLEVNSLLGVNPHLLKREQQEKEGYVWFAAYADFVLSSDMRRALSGIK